MICTVPFTESKSSRPSLSKSNQAVPNPVKGTLGAPSPEGVLRSSNSPEPSLTYRLLPSLVSSVTNKLHRRHRRSHRRPRPCWPRPCQSPACHAREQGGVLEGAVTFVEPELVFLAVVGHVDVDPTVAIEVAPSKRQVRGRTRVRCPTSRSHRQTSRHRWLT